VRPPTFPRNMLCPLTFPLLIQQNSWGPTWGESGYGRVKRVGGCGVSHVAKYALYGTGGIAYVNGTGFYSDPLPAPHPTPQPTSKPTRVAPRHRPTWVRNLGGLIIWGFVLGVLIVPIICYLGWCAICYLAGAAVRYVQKWRKKRRESLARGTSNGTPAPGVDWTCPWCEYLNKPTDAVCDMCRRYPDREEAVAVPIDVTCDEEKALRVQ
jgi:hypothetical protein